MIAECPDCGIKYSLTSEERRWKYIRHLEGHLEDDDGQ